MHNLENQSNLVHYPNSILGKRPCEPYNPTHALFDGIESDNLEDVQEALAHPDVDVNARLYELNSKFSEQVYETETPLHIAVEKASLEIIRALLEAGANPNLYTDDRFRTRSYLQREVTPLHTAIIKGRLDVVRELLNWRANSSLPQFPVSLTDPIDPEYRDCLHLALESVDEGEIFELLYKQNPLLQVQYDLGHTELLSYAIHYDKPQVANFLIGKGALKNWTDPGGVTYLQRAAEAHAEKVLTLFLEYRQVPDNTGSPDFHTYIETEKLTTNGFVSYRTALAQLFWAHHASPLYGESIKLKAMFNCFRQLVSAGAKFDSLFNENGTLNQFYSMLESFLLYEPNRPFSERSLVQMELTGCLPMLEDSLWLLTAIDGNGNTLLDVAKEKLPQNHGLILLLRDKNALSTH